MARQQRQSNPAIRPIGCVAHAEPSSLRLPRTARAAGRLLAQLATLCCICAPCANASQGTPASSKRFLDHLHSDMRWLVYDAVPPRVRTTYISATYPRAKAAAAAHWQQAMFGPLTKRGVDLEFLLAYYGIARHANLRRLLRPGEAWGKETKLQDFGDLASQAEDNCAALYDLTHDRGALRTAIAMQLDGAPGEDQWSYISRWWRADFQPVLRAVVGSTTAAANVAGALWNSKPRSTRLSARVPPTVWRQLQTALHGPSRPYASGAAAVIKALRTIG